MRGDQAGFTLLEMLLAIAVAGVIAPLVTSAIYQITAGTETIGRSNAEGRGCQVFSPLPSRICGSEL